MKHEQGLVTFIHAALHLDTVDEKKKRCILWWKKNLRILPLGSSHFSPKQRVINWHLRGKASA